MDFELQEASHQLLPISKFQKLIWGEIYESLLIGLQADQHYFLTSGAIKQIRYKLMIILCRTASHKKIKLVQDGVRQNDNFM